MHIPSALQLVLSRRPGSAESEVPARVRFQEAAAGYAGRLEDAAQREAALWQRLHARVAATQTDVDYAASANSPAPKKRGPEE